MTTIRERVQETTRYQSPMQAELNSQVLLALVDELVAKAKTTCDVADANGLELGGLASQYAAVYELHAPLVALRAALDHAKEVTG